jgi:hypothetical protein
MYRGKILEIWKNCVVRQLELETSQVRSYMKLGLIYPMCLLDFAIFSSPTVSSLDSSIATGAFICQIAYGLSIVDRMSCTSKYMKEYRKVECIAKDSLSDNGDDGYDSECDDDLESKYNELRLIDSLPSPYMFDIENAMSEFNYRVSLNENL